MSYSDSKLFRDGTEPWRLCHFSAWAGRSALCRTGLSTCAQEPWHYTVLEGSTSVSGISMVPINPWSYMASLPCRPSIAWSSGISYRKTFRKKECGQMNLIKSERQDQIMSCLLRQACCWSQQTAHVVFYSLSQKPCLYKRRTSWFGRKKDQSETSLQALSQTLSWRLHKACQ